MKKLVISLLANAARKNLRKFHPKVVAITGSVGKTSTRQAIAIALEAKYRVRTPMKNYNNEFGLPLAILGEKSPGRNAWEWLKLLKRAYTKRDMPEYLVLEYGADAPGDIKYLAQIARPDVAVITAVSPIHLSQYPSMQALIEEKASLGDFVKADGAIFLNDNDETVRLMRGRYGSVPVMMYGIESGDAKAANVRIETVPEESFDPGEVFAVLKADVSVNGETIALELINCLSPSALTAALAALSVAVHFGVPLSDAARALSEKLRPVAGRLNPIPGIKGALIIDDTYNAAPAAVAAGLDALLRFTPGEARDRRIAVLGDMAELGTLTESEHRAVGGHVARAADLFLAVGPNMGLAADEAVAAGMSKDRVERFNNAVEAGRYLDKIIQKGDVVFVKGSQSMRMEKVVKDVMAEPLRASEILVRQDGKWLAA